MSETSRAGKRDAVQRSIDEQEVRDALLGELAEDFPANLLDAPPSARG